MSLPNLLQFLEEATEPETLNKIRDETLGRAKGDDDDDDDDEEEVKANDGTKKKKKNSPTLQELVYQFFDDDDPCRNGWTCFLAFLREDFSSLDFGRKPAGLLKTAVWANKIRDLTNAANRHDTSTIRGAFVALTKIVKGYWIPKSKKVHDKQRDEHSVIGLWRGILKADQDDVQAALLRAEQARTLKLKNKYSVEYELMAKVVMKLYRAHKSEDTNESFYKLGLALEAAGGMRQGALKDPSVEYFTLTQWNAMDNDIPFRLGDDQGIEISQEHAKDTFGARFIIIQSGVLKDSNQAINKFLLKGDSRYVENRAVRKPTLILTAKQIVDGIQAYRQHFNYTKARLERMKRSKITNLNRSRRIKEIMTENFPRSAAHAAKFGWNFNTHFMRKLYANACWEIYRDQLRQYTGRVIDRGVFMQSILAHQGSLATFLSYANVEVTFNNFDAKVLTAPPEQLMRTFYTELQELKQQMSALMRANSDMKVKVAAVEQTEVEEEKVNLKARDKSKVVVQTLKSFQGSQEAKVREGIKRLNKANVKLTQANLKALNLGSTTLTRFKAIITAAKKSQILITLIIFILIFFRIRRRVW